MINVGFYVDSLIGDESNLAIFTQLNKAVESGVVDDACLFFNKNNFNPVEPKFGIFNATDIWNFEGTLIATNIMNALMASKVVNNFKLYYLYEQDKNFVGLLHLPNTIPILVRTDDDEKFIKRATGRTVIRIDESLDIGKILQVLE